MFAKTFSISFSKIFLTHPPAPSKFQNCAPPPPTPPPPLHPHPPVQLLRLRECSDRRASSFSAPDYH